MVHWYVSYIPDSTTAAARPRLNLFGFEFQFCEPVTYNDTLEHVVASVNQRRVRVESRNGRHHNLIGRKRRNTATALPRMDVAKLSHVAMLSLRRRGSLLGLGSGRLKQKSTVSSSFLLGLQSRKNTTGSTQFNYNTVVQGGQRQHIIIVTWLLIMVFVWGELRESRLVVSST